MSFIHRALAELTKQLQSREPSPKHEEFMNRLLKQAEAQGKQVARVGNTTPHTYCIVDDDLQPVTPQPTEEHTMEHTMLPITSSQRGLLRSLIASFGLSSYTEASSYGHPMQVQPELNFSPSHNTRNSKRKHLSPTKNGSYKRNLRASKRKGKQYKQAKS